LIPIAARFIIVPQLKSKFEKTILIMIDQNIKDTVIRITKPLSLEDVNDIFYKIILEKKLEQSEEDIKNGRLFNTEEAKGKLKKWLK
jgi:hypothetical protein